MARPKRSDINDQNRRQELLLAASRLFSEKGFHGTTIRAIAAATKMQSGSPFYHFANKQELLFTVIMEGLKPLVADLEHVMEQPMQPVERLQAMARIHVESMIHNNVNTVETVSLEWRFLDGAQIETVMALRDRIDKVWQKGLDELAASRQIASSAQPLRLFFLGALTSVRTWYRADGPMTPQDIADGLIEFLLNGAINP